MLNITVIAVGKLKERYFADACSEYAKRLSGMCSLKIIEVDDAPAPEGLSEKEKEDVLEKEARRITDKIPKGSFIIPLCVEGKECSSPEIAEIIGSNMNGGVSSITFIIGGSLGLAKRIKALGDLRLSFSRLTFPHRLMRVILLEQIYRALTILNGRTYHK